MITLRIEAAFGSFRRSFARSYGETYQFVPPATVYGMLLSLVGEHNKRKHLGVKLAFAYKKIPEVSQLLRQASRLKYGDDPTVAGPFMDKYETLTGLDFFCWVNSESEVGPKRPELSQLEAELDQSKFELNQSGLSLSQLDVSLSQSESELDQPRSELAQSHNRRHEPTLETRITNALSHPETSPRNGVLSLGLSDDLVNNIQIVSTAGETAYALKPSPNGYYELPTWVDHVGSIRTSWSRYNIDRAQSKIDPGPGTADWEYTTIMEIVTRKRG